MTLEQLRIFACVAELENMTAAARRLNLTQSAVSAAIAALEDRYGVKLFHRVGRGIELNEAGKAFLAEAGNVLKHSNVAETVLKELGGLERGSLRLIASQTIAAYWLPQRLALFHERYPRLQIDVGVGNTQQAANYVQEGMADIGIVEGNVDNPALAQWEIGRDELQLVGNRDFTSEAIDTAWLQQASWIMREPGSGTRSTLEQHLRELGVDPETLDIALVLPTNESVRTAVEAGAGIAVMSSLVTDTAVTSGNLKVAPLRLSPRAFYGLRHKERYRTKASDAFLELAQEVRDDL
ncbi:LysR family transcriptional regulator [Porphyrobacter algicida]|uniref:LysR family transcriptional regulator n=1 Tax=Qipengyuania algicida TaxID=1836209 RepID=A0A845AN40_9SPHN|nr:LysR family transcriptional regulator [Qipengyuania algicida]MXP28398.1 LysR family transcriptional regulator [Qipengyuania algicida]